MTTFTDNTGRTWAITLDEPMLARVLAETGRDLRKGYAYKAFAKDVMALVQLFRVILETQADERGMSPEAFGEMLAWVIEPAVDALFIEAGSLEVTHGY